MVRVVYMCDTYLHEISVVFKYAAGSLPGVLITFPRVDPAKKNPLKCFYVIHILYRYTLKR